jgi:hypothetical protein
MTAHTFHQIENGSGFINLPTQNHGRKKLPQRGPGSFGPFFGVERAFTGGAFAPTVCAVAVGNPHENYSSRSRTAETGLEKVNEWKVYFAKFDSGNQH